MVKRVCKKCHIPYPRIVACKRHQTRNCCFSNNSIGEQEVVNKVEAVEYEAVVEREERNV